MHQDVRPDIMRITDDTTKAELEEAILGHMQTMKRWPAHWTDQRNRMHARIDALLDDWERAPDPRHAQAG